MLPVVIVNRLLRNVGCQGALLPGQGGQLDGHVAEVGVEWSVRGWKQGEGRGGRRDSEVRKRYANEAAYFLPGSARHVAPERMTTGLSPCR